MTVMSQLPVILIFDVGKTHKKLLLFNEDYELVLEESEQFEQTVDEDGSPCEDVGLLTQWIRVSYDRISKDEKYLLRAVNFSAYGASFVYLSAENRVMLPLYNYLKPYLSSTQELFFRNHGPVTMLSQQTASPFLGSLNSGLQLYRIKIEKPSEYGKIKFALHLPQYLSYILTGQCFSDRTSIGCHTMLWDFQKDQYHKWVKQEGIDEKLAPIKNGDDIAAVINNSVQVGIGLHDSSSALVPYINSFAEPFILISTGTWCISLNPFNAHPLTGEELDSDTLFYLSCTGEPVKASRIFAGNEHELQVKRIAQVFGKTDDHYKSVTYNPTLLVSGDKTMQDHSGGHIQNNLQQSVFPLRDINDFPDFETAYHQLMADIMQQQVYSTRLVLKGTAIKNLFVDGGFSHNEIYMNLLAKAFPELKVCTASVPHASALGAAIAIHSSWNKKNLADNFVSVRHYSPKIIS